MSDQSPTYPLKVEGEGGFIFARRNMRLNITIGVELARLGEGVVLDEFLEVFIMALATLSVLTVSAPPRWTPEEFDPFEPDSYSRVLKVWSALRDKEESFRETPKAPGQGNGAGAGVDVGVLVPEKVPAPAD